MTQDLKPGSQLIAATKARFLELLRLRYSSPLFRLPSAAHIHSQLRHHNTGPDQARAFFSHESIWHHKTNAWLKRKVQTQKCVTK